MKRKAVKKMRPYVCIVCGKKKRMARRGRCCGKNMLSEDKGADAM